MNTGSLRLRLLLAATCADCIGAVEIVAAEGVDGIGDGENSP